MNPIAQFLKKIQNRHAQEILLKSAVVDSIKKSIGLDVAMEDVSYSSGTISIKGISQAARSELFINKLRLMERINSSQNIKTVTDIR